jgi:hypothetical protein
METRILPPARRGEIALASGVLNGESLAPGEGLVQVSACAHPFRTARVDFTVEAGATIAEILAQAQPDSALRTAAHVFIGGNYIPRENWHRVRPKPGTTVAVRVVPMDGGGSGGKKNPLRTVLMIAVLVAAAAVSGGALGPAGLGLFGPAFAAGATGASLAGLAVPLAGDLAINLEHAP